MDEKQTEDWQNDEEAVRNLIGVFKLLLKVDRRLELQKRGLPDDSDYLEGLWGPDPDIF